MTGPTQTAPAQPTQVEHAMPPGVTLEDFTGRHEPNMIAGLSAGMIATLLCAGIWTAVTVATGYQIGWMALGLGVAVGFAVRAAGHGNTRGFGVLGATLALMGCLIGNFFSALIVFANEIDVPVMQVISALNAEQAIALSQAWFAWIDLLFYGIAMGEGYHFAFVTERAHGHLTFEVDDEDAPKMPAAMVAMEASVRQEQRAAAGPTGAPAQPAQRRATNVVAPEKIEGVGRFAAAKEPDEPVKTRIKISMDDDGDNDRAVA